MTTDQNDAIYIGGPRDGTAFSSQGAALVEVDIGGMLHRYIRTHQHRDQDGSSLVVYNYDGEVDPSGGLPGIEAPADRAGRGSGDG
jgi:hypothetical protein